MAAADMNSMDCTDRKAVMDKDENGWAAHAGTCQLEALGDRGRHELRPQLPVCQMRLSLPGTSKEPDIHPQ